MPKLEREDEKTVKTWCKSSGALFIKFTPIGERGWPDRIVQVNGYTLWIELKKKGKKPSPLQVYRMDQLAQREANVAWFDRPEDCIEYIKEFL